MVFLGACSLPISQIPDPQPELSPIEKTVIDYLQNELGVSADKIKIVSIEAVDWPDSCLGIENPDVMCMQVITPGYKVISDVNNEKYEIHTDKAGKTMIIVNKEQTPEIVILVKAHLQSNYGIEPNNVQTISYEAVEWRDSCLGVNEPGKMCMQVITPGYKVILKAEGEIYIFHTNKDGSAIILAPPIDETAVVTMTKEFMAKEMDIDSSDISILSVTTYDWPDGCLGISEEETACIQVITPGLRIELEYEGNVFSYRTNETGSIIKRELVPDPKPTEW